MSNFHGYAIEVVRRKLRLAFDGLVGADFNIRSLLSRKKREICLIGQLNLEQ
jgi:hypothetical protein